MELLIMLLVPLPLGYLVRPRITAYLVYVGVHSFAFTFQSTTLIREWVGGDTAVFDKDPGTVPLAYGLVNLVIYGAGLGLVALGNGLRHRRDRRSEAVDLAV